MCNKIQMDLEKWQGLTDNIYSFPVEDPVDEFRRLRDYVDVMKCLSLPAFKAGNLRNGYSKEMVNAARKHRKINQVQHHVIHFNFLWCVLAC